MKSKIERKKVFKTYIWLQFNDITNSFLHLIEYYKLKHQKVH